MFLHVTHAKHLHDYVVELTFNDGRSGQADLSDTMRGPVFEPLRDIARFSCLHVDQELETVVWDNGADLAPEYLYFKAFKSDPHLQPQFRAWGYVA